MDGYHLQSTEMITLRGVVHVQLTLCLVAEELEERVVHVAGWAGLVHTGETVVDAEWEAYVGNAATGSHACRIGSNNYVGGEEKKKK